MTQNDPAKCQWCGNFHAAKCPLVKAIEYDDSGNMKRVEFFCQTDYHQTDFRVWTLETS